MTKEQIKTIGFIIIIIILAVFLFQEYRGRKSLENEKKDYYEKLQLQRDSALKVEEELRAEIAKYISDLSDKDEELKEAEQGVKERIKYIYRNNEKAHAIADTASYHQLDEYWSDAFLRYKLELK